MKRYIKRFIDGFLLGLSIICVGAVVGILSSIIFLSLIIISYRYGAYMITGGILFLIPFLTGLAYLFKTGLD